MRSACSPRSILRYLIEPRSAIVLQPGHQRRMDHIRHAVPADRLDREIDVLEREAVRGDLLEREALRRELRQRQLARLVAVPACALDGDRLGGDALEREAWEFLKLALDDHGAGLALHRLD